MVQEPQQILFDGYGPAAALLCSKLPRAMAITALFGFWRYWCPYLQYGGLLGYLGFFTLSFALSQTTTVVGAAI